MITVKGDTPGEIAILMLAWTKVKKKLKPCPESVILEIEEPESDDNHRGHLTISLGVSDYSSIVVHGARECWTDCGALRFRAGDAYYVMYGL